MQQPLTVYKILFGLLAIVYLLGLFVPLMDNDAAHHANIGLNMYLTGDYKRLFDAGSPYLDKPHFLFWTAALCYHFFGVTAFAYRLPSFIFTIIGVWSTYRLGQTLYNRNTGLLAALMTASCFAILLANNDVRMEAIVAAAGILATWQGVVWLNSHRFRQSILLALAMAIGFSTKGWSGLIVPVTALIAYVVATKRVTQLLHPQFLIIVAAFCLFISPVLYSYYVQFDRHPELVIRDQTGRSGVRFILWDQNFERFQGEAFGGSGKKNWLMFFHTFLWAFAPWSLLAIVAILRRAKLYFKEGWWLSVMPIAVMAGLITFSGYRLPHYLNVILPFSALLSAAYVNQVKTLPRLLLKVQVIICILALIMIIVLNTWCFPMQNVFVIFGFVALLLTGSLMLLRTQTARWITLSVLSSILVFYLLNTNFYPQLLTYQGGITLANTTAGKIDPLHVYYWPGANSASYSFYSKSSRKNFTDSTLNLPAPIWLLTETRVYNEWKEKGLQAIEMLMAYDYSTDKLKAKFIYPPSRLASIDTLYLIRIK